MKISILVPAYNEEKTISVILDKLIKLSFDDLEKEIIVVNDGSSDGTPKILEDYGKNPKIKVIHHPKNLGKGSAIRTGLEKAGGDIIAIQDADLEYDPEELPRLVRPILNERKDVVYGSRFLGKIEGMSLLHHLGNRFLTFVTRLLYGCSITDMETGYKIFRKKVIDNIELKAKNFEIEPEITAKILKQGHEIHEIPIKYVGRTKLQKKINWKDGVVALKWLIRYRFF